MIEVAVRRGEDLHVAHLEAQLFHARLDVRRRFREARINKDVPLRRGDEVRGQVVTADPVDVAD